MAPFTLQIVQRDGVPREMRDFDVLEDALRERDAVTGYRNAHYCVFDADDAERGYADWCEECGVRGAFGHECQSCRLQARETGCPLCGRKVFAARSSKGTPELLSRHETPSGYIYVEEGFTHVFEDHEAAVEKLRGEGFTADQTTLREYHYCGAS